MTMKHIGQGAEIRAMVEKLRIELPAQVELAMMTAVITRAKYNALVKEGFSEADALYLCKVL
jgi:hypothetical protein